MFKRILIGLATAIVASVALAADVKISAEPAMSALGATDIFLGNQGGVTGTATAAQLATYVMAAPPAAGFGSTTPRPVAATTISATGAITSTLATGTAPFTVASTTNVANLNSATLNGTTFASPAAIGSGTPAAGNFTTLGASGLFQPALGITATGAVINLNASSNFAVNIGTGTTTSTVTLGQNTATPGAVSILGPLSFGAGTAFTGASWTTVSPVWNGLAMTLNDTTASGTVATEVAYSLQAPTFTSTGGASTTITSPVTLYLAAPLCSGGVVCTNFTSLMTAGKLQAMNGIIATGNTASLNASSNSAVNIATGTNNQATTIGGTTAGNIVNLASISIRVGNVLYASVTAPTINSHFNTSGDSIVASSTAAFQITVGSGTGTSTGSLTMPAATTGWACEATDVTTPTTHAIQQTASSTTGVTVTDYIRTTGVAQNFVNGDKINFICGAF